MGLWQARGVRCQEADHSEDLLYRFVNSLLLTRPD